MSIIDLQEITANVWQAKYQGNYGVYKIKVKYDGSRYLANMKELHYFCSFTTEKRWKEQDLIKSEDYSKRS